MDSDTEKKPKKPKKTTAELLVSAAEKRRQVHDAAVKAIEAKVAATTLFGLDDQARILEACLVELKAVRP